jgi:hypothetical protein
MGKIQTKIQKFLKIHGPSPEKAGPVVRVSGRQLRYILSGDSKISPHLELLIDLAIKHPFLFK